jgi:hypothetical protein
MNDWWIRYVKDEFRFFFQQDQLLKQETCKLAGYKNVINDKTIKTISSNFELTS